MMKPDIRDVTDSDAEQLIALWKATWTSTYGPSLGDQALISMLNDLETQGTHLMLPGDGERGFCIATEAEIVGSLILRRNGSTAYLWGMYVKPEHQRFGFGSQLLAWAAATLPRLTNMQARVLHTSEAALSFYRSHGFAEVGTELTELPGNVMVPTAIMEVAVEALAMASRSDV